MQCPRLRLMRGRTGRPQVPRSCRSSWSPRMRCPPTRPRGPRGPVRSGPLERCGEPDQQVRRLRSPGPRSLHRPMHRSLHRPGRSPGRSVCPALQGGRSAWRQPSEAEAARPAAPGRSAQPLADRQSGKKREERQQVQGRGPTHQQWRHRHRARRRRQRRRRPQPHPLQPTPSACDGPRRTGTSLPGLAGRRSDRRGGGRPTLWPTRQKLRPHRRSRWSSTRQAGVVVPRRRRERKAAGLQRLPLDGTAERAEAEEEPAVWRTPSPIRFRCCFRCRLTLTGRGRGARHRPSPQWLLQ